MILLFNAKIQQSHNNCWGYSPTLNQAVTKMSPLTFMTWKGVNKSFTTAPHSEKQEAERVLPFCQKLCYYFTPWHQQPMALCRHGGTEGFLLLSSLRWWVSVSVHGESLWFISLLAILYESYPLTTVSRLTASVLILCLNEVRFLRRCTFLVSSVLCMRERKTQCLNSLSIMKQFACEAASQKSNSLLCTSRSTSQCLNASFSE